MQAIFALISAQLGIRKRLVRRLNQPMTARLMKTARSLKIPHEIGQILCSASASAQIPRRYLGSVRSMKRSFHWSNAVTWCAMWKTTNVVSGWWVDRGLWREGNRTICLHSNSILYRGKRHSKTQNSDNNKQKKYKTNKRKQVRFLKHVPVPTIWTLRSRSSTPRSLLRNRKETLATQATDRLTPG